MIKINLLAVKSTRKKESALNQIVIFFVGVFAVFAGLYWYHSHLANRIDTLNDDIKSTEREIAKYEKIAKEVEEIKKQLSVLKMKLEVIQKLDRSRENGILLLDTMTKMIIEKQMWLTGWEAKERKASTPTTSSRKRGRQKKPEKTEAETGKGNVIMDITIDGIALDNKTVADYMTNLQSVIHEGNPLFSDVKLKTLELKEFKGTGIPNMKTFQVTCLAVPVRSESDDEEKGASKPVAIK